MDNIRKHGHGSCDVELRAALRLDSSQREPAISEIVHSVGCALIVQNDDHVARLIQVLLRLSRLGLRSSTSNAVRAFAIIWDAERRSVRTDTDDPDFASAGRAQDSR